MGRRRAEQGGRLRHSARPGQQAPAHRAGPATAGRHFRAFPARPAVAEISAASLAALLVAVGGSRRGTWSCGCRATSQVAELEPRFQQHHGAPADDNHDALQILIMGTDTRAGQNGEYGTAADSGRCRQLRRDDADEHFGGQQACQRHQLPPRPDGAHPGVHGTQRPGNFSAPEQAGQLNSALSRGGPGCTVAAINQMTGHEDRPLHAGRLQRRQGADHHAGRRGRLRRHRGQGPRLRAGPAGRARATSRASRRCPSCASATPSATPATFRRIKAQQCFLASMTRKIKDDGHADGHPEAATASRTPSPRTSPWTRAWPTSAP